MTAHEKDRIECAIRHIQTAVDVDPWAVEIAVEAMEKEISALQAQDSPKPKAGSVQNVQNEDLILRKAAIDTVKNMRKVCDTENINDYYDLLLAAFDVLPSAQPEPQWIPVEERLPKQDEMVLITIIRKDERYNKIPFISIGYISWNNTVWWCAHDGDCKSANVEVLAWMPLPEPYRAERRNDAED